jgi:hypothetical protein
VVKSTSVKGTPVEASASGRKGKAAAVKAAAVEAPAVKAAAVEAPASGSKGKDKDTPNVVPAPKRPPPGPLNKPVHRAYVEIRTSSKRKAIDIQEESSKSEEDDDDDDEDEDDYLAGRVSGLNAFVRMMETACATMRKEINEIDGRVSKRRRRHY